MQSPIVSLIEQSKPNNSTPTQPLLNLPTVIDIKNNLSKTI